VLPGEAMRVFILKEGKEYNQGVAYLDDGTMWWWTRAQVIGKTVDIAVTSVLQRPRENDLRQMGERAAARHESKPEYDLPPRSLPPRNQWPTIGSRKKARASHG